MVSVIGSGMVDREFESRSGKLKTIKLVVAGNNVFGAFYTRLSLVIK